MKVHANAPLGPKGRETMVLRVLERGWSLAAAAAAAGVSERTCSKWIKRYGAEGAAGLLDRSSAPRSIPHRTPDVRRAGFRGDRVMWFPIFMYESSRRSRRVRSRGPRECRFRLDWRVRAQDWARG